MTLNFQRAEFACKCGCGNDGISEKLVSALQHLRDIVRRPLTINSGVRCWGHNAAIGGKPHSQHLRGTAADVAIPSGMDAEIFADLAESIPAFQLGGIGIYKRFIHLDVRGYRARWAG